MRILYDHQLFSLQNSGGASRYHYELLRYLSDIPDIRAELFLGMNGTVYPVQALSSANTRVMGFRTPLRPGGGRYIANEVLGNCVAPFLGTLDVYHPTLYRQMPLVRTRRVVATHYDCTHERFPYIFRYLKEVLRAKKLLYRRADAIICISEASRKDLLEFYGVNPAKTRVIYLGLTSLPRCPDAANKLRERLPRNYLLYVGSRAAYKNFTALLNAFRRTHLHDRLDLLVLGGGPLTPEETAVAEDLKLGQKLVSIPKVSDGFLAEAYAAATVLVYPSLWEGFGLPPLEAMSLGCPVVACRTSSIPEVCRDAPFYFDPGDDKSFEDALMGAIDDDAARRQAIERGRKIAAEYTWEKCGSETLALYRECQ